MSAPVGDRIYMDGGRNSTSADAGSPMACIWTKSMKPGSGDEVRIFGGGEVVSWISGDFPGIYQLVQYRFDPAFVERIPDIQLLDDLLCTILLAKVAV
jgi:hypothetical protein